MNAREPWEVVDGRAMAAFEIYIKTTPERLWEAIVDPELRKKYNFGVGVSSDWTAGSEYRSEAEGGIEIAAGQNLEVEPPRRLVQSFQALWSEDVKAVGHSRVTWEIEPVGEDSCRLLVIHDQLPEGANSELFGGWSMILSGLKTLLETGELLTTPGSLRYSEAAGEWK
ncbi:MAG TPA: SRPBCC family protein [Solirubrobacterales bacterium]|nr:SRPBCC family protein [Solirubrobacterales bacterium]